MDRMSSPIPGDAIRGIASGVLFMAFFGTLWAGIGIGAMQGWGWPWLTIVTLLIGIALLGAGISLLLSARNLPDDVSEADAQQGKRTGIWFGIIFAAEFLFIAIAAWICNAVNRFDLFFPIMALIVGLHFFPLAALFRVKIHYLAGALICLIALITLLVVPESANLAGQEITIQQAVLGFGEALILWGVGLVLWLQGRRWLLQSEIA